MSLKIYVYNKCGTCRKALKYLDEQGIDYTAIPIREQPPTPTELRRMLKYYEGNIRRIFNTSSGDYKELNMKSRLPKMSADDAVELLSKTGNLVKRPFALGKDFGIVGFKQEEWDAIFK